MTTTEAAAIVTPAAIHLWNSTSEEIRRGAIAKHGSKEEAIAELALVLIKEALRREEALHRVDP